MRFSQVVVLAGFVSAEAFSPGQFVSKAFWCPRQSVNRDQRKWPLVQKLRRKARSGAAAVAFASLAFCQPRSVKAIEEVTPIQVPSSSDQTAPDMIRPAAAVITVAGAGVGARYVIKLSGKANTDPDNGFLTSEATSFLDPPDGESDKKSAPGEEPVDEEETVQAREKRRIADLLEQVKDAEKKALEATSTSFSLDKKPELDIDPKVLRDEKLAEEARSKLLADRSRISLGRSPKREANTEIEGQSPSDPVASTLLEPVVEDPNTPASDITTPEDESAIATSDPATVQAQAAKAVSEKDSFVGEVSGLSEDVQPIVEKASAIANLCTEPTEDVNADAEKESSAVAEVSDVLEDVKLEVEKDSSIADPATELAEDAKAAVVEVSDLSEDVQPAVAKDYVIAGPAIADPATELAEDAKAVAEKESTVVEDSNLSGGIQPVVEKDSVIAGPAIVDHVTELAEDAKAVAEKESPVVEVSNLSGGVQPVVENDSAIVDPATELTKDTKAVIEKESAVSDEPVQDARSVGEKEHVFASSDPTTEEDAQLPVEKESASDDSIPPVEVEQSVEDSDSFSHEEKQRIGDAVFECHGFFPDLRAEHELPTGVRNMRQQPKSKSDLAAIKQKYAAISDEAERVHTMLIDLGMMESYDHLEPYTDDFDDYDL